MSERAKAWLAWSSGKDSAWSLHVVRRQLTGRADVARLPFDSGHREKAPAKASPDVDLDVVALLTTVNRTHGRVAMHAVRESLLEAQAASVGLPLVTVSIPSPCSNEEYERAMSRAMSRARDEGVTHMVFGDLFLEDVRRYREENLAKCGMTAVFPLWGIPTAQLASQMIAGGLRSYITCVDPRQIDKSFAGREWNEALLMELPPSADPCGERGEFHTFACAGPMFPEPIRVRPGEVVERDGFVFADLIG